MKRTVEEIEAEARAAGIEGRRLHCWLLFQQNWSVSRVAREMGIPRSTAQADRQRCEGMVWWYHNRQRDRVATTDEQAEKIPAWAWEQGALLRDAMRHNRPEAPNPLVGREGDTAHIGRQIHASRLGLVDYARVCLYEWG